jgi:hypothetical protein
MKGIRHIRRLVSVLTGLAAALAQYGPDVIHTQRGVGYSLRLPCRVAPA